MQTTIQNRARLLSVLPILGFGISAQDPTLLEIQMQTSEPGTSHRSALNESELRTHEASHLEVYAGCKWGKASFAPTLAYDEPLSTEIRALYESMT